MSGYNYADFVLEREVPFFEAFRGRLHVGQQAPDATLLRLDDLAEVRLSSLWSTGGLGGQRAQRANPPSGRQPS